MIAAFIILSVSSSCFDRVDGFLPRRGIPLSRFRGRTPIGSSSSSNTVHDVFESSPVELLDQLKAEREQKRVELLAADLAVRTLESNQSKNNSQAVIRGTYDYGFSSKSGGCDDIASKNRDGGSVPASAIALAWSNFRRELKNLLADVAHDGKLDGVSGPLDDARQKLNELTLSNAAIWKREESRPPIQAPWIIKAPYLILCVALDTLFDGNPIERFYFLETVARMPYFSYITMLHAYETLGWWRRSTQAKRVHFAEEYNEFNHLLMYVYNPHPHPSSPIIWSSSDCPTLHKLLSLQIHSHSHPHPPTTATHTHSMESLGGDQNWRVRFLAQHAAIVYYFVLIALWLTSPSLAYNFSEIIEAHAVDTYAEFAESNKVVLSSLAAPPCAKAYYENPDLYIFDEFQTATEQGRRRPVVNTLYDVFCNIRDDEGQHVATMSACQDPEVVVRSPNTEAAIATTAAAATLAWGYLSSVNGLGMGAVSSFDFNELFSLGEGKEATSLLESIAESVMESLGAMLSTTTEMSEQMASFGSEVTEAGAPAAMETLEAAAAAMSEEVATNGVNDAVDVSIILNILKQLSHYLPFGA